MINLFPSTLTRKVEITSLIKKLRPVNPGIEFVRLGPVGDGGYLVPDDLHNIEACFSPGVCEISGFENDCAEIGMQVFMADKSVDKPALNHKNFHFIKKYIGATSSNDFITMDDWLNSSLKGSNGDLILQMDIEGFEYEAFLSMSANSIDRFRIIVCEFHNLHNLWNKPFFNLVNPVFEKILNNHTCVHIHPNNCNSPLTINVSGELQLLG